MSFPFDNGCECDILDGGFCKRHNVQKSLHLVTLCRTKPVEFKAWEEGRGHGQVPHSWHRIVRDGTEVKSSGPRKPCGGCGDGKKALTLMGEAWDVGKALAAFTLSGFRFVDKEEYQRRLDVCTGCDNRGDERVKHNTKRCGECGCFVAVKAQAKAWQCPIGKWNKETVDGH